MKKYLASAALIGAAVAVAVMLAVTGDKDNGIRSPLEVAGAFVYHLDHGNFGKACGLYADSYRGGSVERCSASFVYSSAVPLAFWGVDLFDGMHVVAHPPVDNPDGTVSFKVASDAIAPTRITLRENAEGRWRIVKIG